MTETPRPTRTRWQRFVERGGLSFLLTLLAAPFVFHLFHHLWRFDLFYSILFGLCASVAFAQIILLPLGLALFGIYSHLTHRGSCPACHQRGLRAGIRVSEPTEDPRLRRQFVATECTACGRHLRVFEDGTFEEETSKA
jgi:hypothetical protein